MREWPSIVPGAPQDYYIVVNHYGRFGTAFAETGLDRADYETTGRASGVAAVEARATAKTEGPAGLDWWFSWLAL